MAYRIAEDARVSVPVLVNLDGFYLSFTREPVELPDPELVRAFLPVVLAQASGVPGLAADGPGRRGAGAGRPTAIFATRATSPSETRSQVHAEAAAEFGHLFGRCYGPVESDQLEDAEIVLVMGGSFSSKARWRFEQWRRAGRKVGLLAAATDPTLAAR